jgi:hypothetical protein
MALPWTMTPLAVDPFRQRAAEFRPRPIVLDLISRVRVVTRQASLVDDAAKVEMGSSVVARTHRPVTATFGVPAHRQLQQPAIGRAVHERSCMIAGADHEVGGELGDIGFLAAKPYLVTPLQERAAAFDHRVIPIGRGMMDSIVGREIGRWVAGLDKWATVDSSLRQGSSHTR